jgi:hypothetical protein
VSTRTISPAVREVAAELAALFERDRQSRHLGAEFAPSPPTALVADRARVLPMRGEINDVICHSAQPSS